MGFQENELKPEFLSLSELFSGRLFRIPNYQRAYSWKNEHRQALLDDITTSIEEDRLHFMATVVGLREGGTELIAAKRYHYVSIVDGQQRITTLIILYKAISKMLDGANDDEREIKHDLDKTLVKSGGTLLLLQTNHDLSEYFSTYLRKGEYPPHNNAATSADRNMLEAIEKCEKFVQEWKSKKNLSQLISHINNNLKFVYHEIGDEALVYKVFELLNSRGLTVSPFDLLKSRLMSMVFDSGKSGQTRDNDLSEVHRRWSAIFKALGKYQLGSTVLRFSATLLELYRGKLQPEKESVDVLVKGSKDPGSVIDTVIWISKVTNAVVKIHERKHEAVINKILHVRLVAVAINLRDDLKNKKELLDYNGKIAFGIYCICRRDSRNTVGAYVRLAYAIHKEKIAHAEIKRRLAVIAHKFEIDEEIKKLSKMDCYNDWQDELRYLLYKYEEHLAKEKGENVSKLWSWIWKNSLSKTVEHIMPQSKKKAYTHYLGNLFLLPPEVNARLGTLSPQKKAEEYRKNRSFDCPE